MPQLRAQTTPLPRDVDLLRILPAESGALAWLRDGHGMVGAGEAWRFNLAPRDEAPTNGRRFAEAAQTWDMLMKRAEIRDELRRPGTGLVAFGSFSFTGSAEAGSTLIVPQVLVGRDDDGAWLTIIGPTDTDVFDTLEPEAQTLLNAALKGEYPEYEPLDETRLTNESASKETYVTDVVHAKDAMGAGVVQKVVISRRLHLESQSNIDERTLTATLAGAYPKTWTYAVDGLVGSSPEMLARRVDDHYEIRVLAGSQEPGAQDDELFTPKNSHEHTLAVESVLASLKPLGGSVTRSEPFALHLPNVTHIATDLVATPGFETSALQVAGALHPTAALGGTPTAAALDLIVDIESEDRDRYGAPVGWMGAGGMGEWCVALRCVRITSPTMAVAFAGGGILPDSIPESELAETEAKFAPIVQAFGIDDSRGA